MNIENKIANHFNVASTDLVFDNDNFFNFSNSCTVIVKGVAFDVWFDDAMNIKGAAKAC